ncbi:MAG: AmmeMemoRadiSam system protein B [Methanobacteriota archaeon]
MRRPIVAGKFYAGNETALRAQVEWCFRHKVGLGRLPQVSPQRKGDVRGCVVPHAGFMYSGPVAAHSYAAVAEDGVPDVFVVLGPNHTGRGSDVSVMADDFDTPMGKVEVDKEIAKAMRTGIIADDASAHAFEHSIEVQLPFIKHIAPKAKLVPVCMMMQDYETAREAGKTIGKAISGRSAVVLASTDFSHYVSAETAKRKDSLAIGRITALDPKGLHQVVEKNGISMCGYGPVMAMMEAIQPKSARLLKYATSGDLAPMKDVVGYAAIALG